MQTNSDKQIIKKTTNKFMHTFIKILFEKKKKIVICYHPFVVTPFIAKCKHYHYNLRVYKKQSVKLFICLHLRVYKKVITYNNKQIINKCKQIQINKPLNNYKKNHAKIH